MAVTFATPFIQPRFNIGAAAPPKPNLAWVGLGAQGIGNLRSLIGDAHIVALCDVDLRKEGRAEIEIDGTSYDFLTGAAILCPGAVIYQDFRKMLLEMGDRIDAVGVSTHDSNHFAVADMAMEMGKHVLVQKPLAHSQWEVRTLQQKAVEKRVITQMGNQGHAHEAHGTLIDKCVEDARSAMRWVKSHAGELGIGPDKVIALGGSTGGTLSLLVARASGSDATDDDIKLSPRPCALVLFNPAIMFFGTEDRKFLEIGREFCRKAHAQGRRIPHVTRLSAGATENQSRPRRGADAFRSHGNRQFALVNLPVEDANAAREMGSFSPVKTRFTS